MTHRRYATLALLTTAILFTAFAPLAAALPDPSHVIDAPGCTFDPNSAIECQGGEQTGDLGKDATCVSEGADTAETPLPGGPGASAGTELCVDSSNGPAMSHKYIGKVTLVR